ncbi:hypothetical protein ColKHC_06892 [Colletotrichum higginsianum]|nr:hypothetical protein ColKHC_06892 [Colletotrichum higginsianum]
MHAHGDSLLFHPNSAGHHIFDLNLALIIVSTILISLRIIVRKFVVKAMGWDDLIAIVAWGLCVTLSALEMDTTNYGTGAQMEDVPRQTILQFLKRLSIMELVYLIASGACKDKSEEQSMMLAHAIISIFVDCMLVALPLWVVTNYLKMGVKAIQILLVFSFGIFAVATGIVRLSIIITTDFSVNT